jgi:hypothetical protein
MNPIAVTAVQAMVASVVLITTAAIFVRRAADDVRLGQRPHACHGP